MRHPSEGGWCPTMASVGKPRSEAEKRVLIVLYNGFTEYEYEFVVLALYHNGIPFDVVGLDRREVSGMLDMSTKLPRVLGDVDSREFAALVLPGVANGILKANGAEEPVDQQSVFLNPVLQETVRQFHREGKLVAAICSATVVLAAAGILKARRFTSPMGDNELFKGAIRVRQPAVRDANIITGVGARPYHFCDLLVEALAGEEAASGYREHVGIHR